MRLRSWPTADRIDGIAADQEGQELAEAALSASAAKDQPSVAAMSSSQTRGSAREATTTCVARGRVYRAAIKTPILEVSCWYCQSGVWSNVGAGLTCREATAIRG
jgi:hypothetical protein